MLCGLIDSFVAQNQQPSQQIYRRYHFKYDSSTLNQDVADYLNTNQNGEWGASVKTDYKYLYVM